MSYLSTVLADSPVHYWRLAENLPSIAHDIGSSQYALAISNAATCGFSGIAADGAAVVLQPTTGIVSSNDTISQTFPLSIECWWWPHRAAAASSGSHVLFGWPAAGATSMALSMNTSRQIVFATTGGLTLTSPAVSLQHWHHVVVTCGITNAILYVDAINRGGPTAHGMASPINQRVGIGIDGVNFAGSTSGAICEVAVYGAALSATQVSNHFLAQEVTGAPVNLAPVFQGSGGGGSTSIFADLSDILSSVRKTFPTT